MRFQQVNRVKLSSALELQHNTRLKHFNTFGIDAVALNFVEIDNPQKVIDCIQAGVFTQKHLILGGGSNILLEGDFPGTVVKNNLKGITMLNEDADYVWVKAAGGETWHDLVLFAVSHNWGGIENMSLIPGTVGAAPIQNIGAYGVELVDVFEELEAINLTTGEIAHFNKTECHFGYRTSIFKTTAKGQFFITSVTLRLSKLPQIKMSYGAIQDVLKEKGIHAPTISDISAAVIAIRSSKLPDPKVLGNAGSFFKNPEIVRAQFEALKLQYPEMPGYPAQHGLTKVPAGWLIEQCGWKGKRVGNTGAHVNQALVLVNYGNATGKEIMDLAAAIQNSVMEKFGIAISPEVNLIS